MKTHEGGESVWALKDGQASHVQEEPMNGFIVRTHCNLLVLLRVQSFSHYAFIH